MIIDNYNMEDEEEEETGTGPVIYLCELLALLEYHQEITLAYDDECDIVTASAAEILITYSEAHSLEVKSLSVTDDGALKIYIKG